MRCRSGAVKSTAKSQRRKSAGTGDGVVAFFGANKQAR